MARFHKVFSILAAALALAASGCAGGAADEGASAASASSLAAVPSFQVPRDVWEPAPAGCDGRLSPGMLIAAAEGEPALRVGVVSGVAVCADTVDGLGDDLRLAGLVAVSAGIGEPLRALPAALVHRDDSAAGDPSPQPSLPRRPVVAPLGMTMSPPTEGDPSPQPSQPVTMGSTTTSSSTTGSTANYGPTDGDPSPQPSQPRDATHVVTR